MGPPQQESAQDTPGKALPDPEIARKAMLDDLGIERLDELPLEDGGNDRGRGRYDRPPPRPQHVSQSNPPLMDVWREAMVKGVFNDSDAAEVKGLDDLGGGRVHDVKRKAGMMLEGLASKRRMDHHDQFNRLNNTFSRHHQQGREVPPNLQVGRRKQNVPLPPGLHTNSPFPLTPITNGARPATPHGKRSPANRPIPNGPRRSSPRQSPRQQHIRPISAPAYSLPESKSPPRAIGTNRPVPGKLVYKLAVKIAIHAHPKPIPAMLYLSVVDSPDIGYFTLDTISERFFEVPITSWYDYTSSFNNELIISFKSPSGSFVYHNLHFGHKNDIAHFLTKLKTLRAGGFSGAEPLEVAQTAVQQANFTQDVPVKEAANQETIPRKPSSLKEGEKVPITGIAGNTWTTEATANPSVLSVPEPAVATASASDAMLIDFDANALPTAAPPSEAKSAAEDLATLEPFDFSFVPVHQSTESAGEGAGPCPENSSTSESDSALCLEEERQRKMQEFKALIHDMAQKFYNVFSITGQSGKTLKEHRDTLDGIKGALFDYCMSVQDGIEHSEKKKVLEEIFAEIFPKAPTSRRVVYTAEQLLSRKKFMISPPHWLTDLRFLPERQAPPGSPWGKFATAKILYADIPEPGHSTPIPKPEYSVGVDSEKSKRMMDWVQGGPPVPAPEVQATVPKRANDLEKAAASKATAKDQDRGLKGSLWASSDAKIENENSFTGPAYELHDWPKDSYIHDLAALEQFMPESDTGASTARLTSHLLPSPAQSTQAAVTSTRGDEGPVHSLCHKISMLSIHDDATETAGEMSGSGPTQIVSQVLDQPKTTAVAGAVRGLGASRHAI